MFLSKNYLYKLQEISVRLTIYGGEPLPVCGEIVIDVSHGSPTAIVSRRQLAFWAGTG